jgi:hypothetical protein
MTETNEQYAYFTLSGKFDPAELSPLYSDSREDL